MYRFFIQEINGDLAKLNAEESRHLAKVLRCSEGELVEGIDGSGKLFKATIVNANHKNAILKIEETTLVNEKYQLSIAIAPTKNLNRWEFFLEKATEIGIDNIYPIISTNSERKVLKIERSIKIIKSAVKQSLKTTVPKITELSSLKEILEMPFEGEKYIAHCEEDSSKEAINSKGNKLILIGPEGDFSPAEIQLAKQHNFKSITLGNSRLRTETAGIVACSIASDKLQ